MQIAAHRGFREDFLAYFHYLGADSSTPCARGVQRRSTVIVEDVERDADFARRRSRVATAISWVAAATCELDQVSL